MRTTKGDAPCSPVHGGWWVDFAFKVTACGLMVWTVFWCGLSFVLDCLLWFGLSYGSDGLLVAHTPGSARRVRGLRAERGIWMSACRGGGSMRRGGGLRAGGGSARRGGGVRYAFNLYSLRTATRIMHLQSHVFHVFALRASTVYYSCIYLCMFTYRTSRLIAYAYQKKDQLEVAWKRSKDPNLSVFTRPKRQ